MEKNDIEILHAYIISEGGFISKIVAHFVDIKNLKFYGCEDKIDGSNPLWRDLLANEDFEDTVKEYVSCGKLKTEEKSMLFMRDRFSYSEGILNRIKHYSSLILQRTREEKLNKLINNK